MTTLSKNDLLKYLAQVKSLEVSLYLQEKIIEHEDSELNKLTIPEMKSTLYMPSLYEIPLPQKPAEIKPRPANPAILCFGWLFILFGIFWGLRCLVEGTIIVIIPFLVIICFGVFIISRDSISKRKREADEYNAEQLKQWEEEVERIKKENKKQQKQYEKDIQKYNLDQKKELNRYNTSCNLIKIRQEITRKGIANLQKSYNDTKNALNHLYSYDIIYPKYRNLVAICSIYEYLESGRVENLAGSDGAYNLFELELRQDIIIYELKQIASKLDSIMKNQYLLYNELTSANSTANTFIESVNRLRQHLQSIESSQELIAYNTSIIKNNTEALNMITALNFTNTVK